VNGSGAAWDCEFSFAVNSAVPEGWMFDEPRELVYVKRSFTEPDLTIQLSRETAPR
jgi:hypothetical protein